MAGELYAIIGTGRVGTAVGHLLADAGEQVIAVSAITEESRAAAERYVPGARVSSDIFSVATEANTIFITVPDDVIPEVAGSLADAGALQPGDRVVHVSGALGLDVLEPAREAGAEVISIHPLQTFVDTEAAIARIPGTVFAVTAGSDAGRLWAHGLVELLGGRPLDLRPEDKVLYHAGAVFACNLFLAVEKIAEGLLVGVGMSEEEARSSLLPLIEGTLDNMRRLGTTRALTGPVARGDIGVVRDHLAALKRGAPEVLAAYASLSLAAVRMAEALPRERAAELNSLLRVALAAAAKMLEAE